MMDPTPIAGSLAGSVTNPDKDAEETESKAEEMVKDIEMTTNERTTIAIHHQIMTTVSAIHSSGL